MRATGTHAATISPGGCAAALIDAGIVGSNAHLLPHPVVTQRPPYSEYRSVPWKWTAGGWGGLKQGGGRVLVGDGILMHRGAALKGAAGFFACICVMQLSFKMVCLEKLEK
jgi:hypothetical protein